MASLSSRKEFKSQSSWKNLMSSVINFREKNPRIKRLCLIELINFFRLSLKGFQAQSPFHLYAFGSDFIREKLEEEAFIRCLISFLSAVISWISLNFLRSSGLVSSVHSLATNNSSSSKLEPPHFSIFALDFSILSSG